MGDIASAFARFTLPALGLLGGVLSACAATPPSKTTDGSVDVADQLPPPDDNPFSSDASDICKLLVARATAVRPEILVLLDRSASMNDSLGATAESKWAQMTAALDGFLPLMDANVAWGLMFFGGGQGPSNCAVSQTPAWAPGLGAASAIADAISRSQPAGSSPLSAAVEAASTYLASRNNGAPKFLLLATDGQASCGTSVCAADSTEPPNTCDESAAIAALAAARARDIGTFVVGVAAPGSTADGVLGSMASAGGYPRKETPPYYGVNSGGIDTALAPVLAASSLCYFRLSSIGVIKGVTADGVDLAPSAYRQVGNQGFELTGEACADYLAGKLSTFEVEVSCRVT